MTIARKDIVSDGEECAYHCVARCVRRAFLCGRDPYSGQNYSHRKAWVRERLEHLAGLFGLEVVTYAVMSNHLHVIVRSRPDVSGGWDAGEVARRWLALFPGKWRGQARVNRMQVLSREVKRIEELRGRLGSVSWFMRCLNESVARRANQEDRCKGRFWEGRFKCQRLLDAASLLACMAYVDLNPVRAKVAQTPEKSMYTGGQERIVARQAKARIQEMGRARRAERKEQPKGKRALTLEQGRRIREELKARKADRWLCPVDQRGGGKHGRRGVLPLSGDEYLELLDWTGREIRRGKPGAIPIHLAPVLQRLCLDVAHWVETVQRYGSLFWRVAGQVESILAAARRSGRRWFKGVRSGQEIFAAEAS